MYSFLVAKNRANNVPRFESFSAVCSRFEMAKSSRPKATAHRSSCASTMFLLRSYPKGHVEVPDSEDPECLMADLPSCQPQLARIDLCRHEKIPFFSAHTVAAHNGLNMFVAIRSASNSSS